MDQEEPLTAEERRELEEYRRIFGAIANWTGSVIGKHIPAPPETRHIAGPDETKKTRSKRLSKADRADKRRE